MENETNQTNLRWTIQDVRITPNEMDAIITTIRIGKASTVYGSECKKADQELIILGVENDQHQVKTEQTMPYYPSSDVPDNSKLGIFLRKYGKLETGMQIRIEKDNNGFWKIRL